MTRRLLTHRFLPLLAAIGLFSLWLFFQASGSLPTKPLTRSEIADGQAADPDATGQEAMPSSLLGQARPESIPPQLPASLAGTVPPDGWAELDASGNLVSTPALRQLFEYYLSAIGEETLEHVVARIEKALMELPEPARGQALGILGNYLDYKLAVADLEAAYTGARAGDVSALESQMTELQALRRVWMDAATVEAFFAEEEALDRFQLDRMRIAANPDLSDVERAQAMRHAELALPEPMRLAREASRQFEDYERTRQTLADDPQALATWRESTFGPEAARRLAAVEQAQADWDRRWQAYVGERDSLGHAGLAGPELDAALEDLRRQYFSESELVRAQALDSLR